MIVVGKISELIDGEEGLCMALSECTQGVDFRPERIVVHKDLEHLNSMQNILQKL